MQTLEHEPALELQMNDIAAVEFEAASPLFFDPYDRNRVTGSFILIDPISNATVGAAMIQSDATALVEETLAADSAPEQLWANPVSAQDRYNRHGHAPALVFLDARPNLAAYLERALFAQGFEVLHLSYHDLVKHNLETLLNLANSLGLLVILSGESQTPDEKRRLKKLAADRGLRFVFDLNQQRLPADDREAVPAVLALLAPVRLDSNPDDVE